MSIALFNGLWLWSATNVIHFHPLIWDAIFASDLFVFLIEPATRFYTCRCGRWNAIVTKIIDMWSSLHTVDKRYACIRVATMYIAYGITNYIYQLLMGQKTMKKQGDTEETLYKHYYDDYYYGNRFLTTTSVRQAALRTMQQYFQRPVRYSRPLTSQTQFHQTGTTLYFFFKMKTFWVLTLPWVGAA